MTAEPESTGESPSLPQVKPTSKAGRDLPAAIGVGVAFGVLLLLGLFFPPVMVFTAALTAGVGAWEVAHALNDKRGHGIPAVATGALTVMTVVASYIHGVLGLVMCTAVSAVILLVWTLLLSGRRRTANIPAATFGILGTLLWVPVLMSIPIVYLGSVERGWLGILMILLMAISNDTFGYIAGVNWGRHPMAPKISPKKSWEGLAGSIIGSALVAIVTLIIVGQPWWYGLLVAPVMVVASTAGDLMESVVKRRLGVKDMSNILPGHGGMMDRLDSILFAAAAGCLIFGTVMPL